MHSDPPVSAAVSLVRPGSRAIAIFFPRHPHSASLLLMQKSVECARLMWALGLIFVVRWLLHGWRLNHKP